jgi:uroporphyrinogen decarboxylase
MQISFTPEFADRLRQDLEIEEQALHNPHGGGNTYVLERALGQDMLLTSVGWANSYYASNDDTYRDEWGVTWRRIPYATRFGVGHYTEMVGHPLADASAFDTYEPPDPGREALYVEPERVIREFADTYWIVGVTVTTIFETAWALRGYEQTLVDLATDPDLVDRLFDIPYQYHFSAAKHLVDLGVDMIWTGDDVGAQNQMLISPAVWRRHLKPRMAVFFDTLKRMNPDLKIAYHSDGYIEPIIPDLIDIGLDVLNPVQPQSMDPARLKKEYGDKLSFWGSVDEQHTLPFGTPEAVRSEVRNRIRTLGRNGGLILGPTHHIQLDTPMENLRALVDTIVDTPYSQIRERSN